MHPMLQNFYGTQEKLASAQQAQQAQQTQPPEVQLTPEEEAFSNLVFSEMEKQASVEGINLSTLSEEDLAAVYNQYAELIGGQVVEEQEKTAAFAEAAAQLGVDPAALREADTLGRVMYHAYISEATSATEGDDLEKQAAAELAAFDEIAEHRANSVLLALQGDASEFVKTATMEIEDEEINDYLDERAGEMLEAAGWNLDDLASALDSDV